MTAVTIRSVHDETLTALKVRAAQSGQSLQAYLLDLIERDAATPTMADIADRLAAHASVDLTDHDIPALIEEGRAR